MNYRRVVLNHNGINIVVVIRIAMIDLLLVALRYFLFSSILIFALISVLPCPQIRPFRLIAVFVVYRSTFLLFRFDSCLLVFLSARNFNLTELILIKVFIDQVTLTCSASAGSSGGECSAASRER